MLTKPRREGLQAMWGSAQQSQILSAWHCSRIAEIHAIAAREDDDFQTASARLKLAAREGHLNAVEKQLRSWLEARPYDGWIDEDERHILNCCISCGFMNLISAFVGAGRDGKAPLHWEITTDLSEYEQEYVVWSVDANGATTLAISHILLLQPNAEVLFERLIDNLHLISEVLSKDLDAGTRLLLLGDNDRQDGTISPSSQYDNAVLVPDSMFLHHHAYIGFRDWHKANDIPWEKRIDLVFWRGSSSGHAPSWRENPRIVMCQLLQNSELAHETDVGVVDLVQMSQQDVAEARASGVVRERSPLTDLIKYRYHIDIDGNSNSWPGFFLKLSSGSPIFKVQSAAGYRQWYYDRLVAWKHYVPVRADLSDLVDNIKLLRSKPKLARSIGEAAREVASKMTLKSEVEFGARQIAKAFSRPVSHARSRVTQAPDGKPGRFGAK